MFIPNPAITGFASATALVSLMAINLGSNESLADGVVIDTPGKAVMGSIALGAGNALDELGQLDELTEIRLNIIEDDMPDRLRETFSPSEQIAYKQAMRGEWSVESLNEWMDTLYIEADILHEITGKHGAAIRDLSYSSYNGDQDIAQIVEGKPLSYKISFDTLVAVESFFDAPLKSFASTSSISQAMEEHVVASRGLDRLVERTIYVDIDGMQKTILLDDHESPADFEVAISSEVEDPFVRQPVVIVDRDGFVLND